MHFQRVVISWPGATCSAFLESALQLCEEPEAWAEMKVRRKLISLEQISRRIRLTGSKAGLTEQLKSFADFATKRDVPSR